MDTQPIWRLMTFAEVLFSETNDINFPHLSLNDLLCLTFFYKQELAIATTDIRPIRRQMALALPKCSARKPMRGSMAARVSIATACAELTIMDATARVSIGGISFLINGHVYICIYII